MTPTYLVHQIPQAPPGCIPREHHSSIPILQKLGLRDWPHVRVAHPQQHPLESASGGLRREVRDCAAGAARVLTTPSKDTSGAAGVGGLFTDWAMAASKVELI